MVYSEESLFVLRSLSYLLFFILCSDQRFRHLNLSDKQTLYYNTLSSWTHCLSNGHHKLDRFFLLKPSSPLPLSSIFEYVYGCFCWSVW